MGLIVILVSWTGGVDLVVPRVGSHKSHEANELPAEAPLANVLESNPESCWGGRVRMTLKG